MEGLRDSTLTEATTSNTVARELYRMGRRAFRGIATLAFITTMPTVGIIRCLIRHPLVMRTGDGIQAHFPLRQAEAIAFPCGFVTQGETQASHTWAARATRSEIWEAAL